MPPVGTLNAAQAGTEVDSIGRTRSVEPVSSWRSKLAIVLLAAFWLTATQHCGLEAAGVLAGGHGETSSPSGCCPTTADGCLTDGCATVEDGLYRSDGYEVKIGTPSPATLDRGLDVCAPRGTAAAGSRARLRLIPSLRGRALR